MHMYVGMAVLIAVPVTVAELGTFEAASEALANLDEWTSAETVHTPFIVSPSRLGKSMIRKVRWMEGWGG